MFCKYCGQLIGNDVDEVCSACKAKFSAKPTPPVKEGNIKDGLKGGIIAMVFAFVASLILLIAFILLDVAYLRVVEFDINKPANIDYYPGYLLTFVQTSNVLCYVSMPLSIPFIIIGLIFGIKSLKLFFKAKKEGRVKPIPTVILGAEATLTAIVSFILILCIIVLLIAMHFAFPL